jgi:hypothetical protein
MGKVMTCARSTRAFSQSRLLAFSPSRLLAFSPLASRLLALRPFSPSAPSRPPPLLASRPVASFRVRSIFAVDARGLGP